MSNRTTRNLAERLGTKNGSARPNPITVLCVVLFVIGLSQFVGSVMIFIFTLRFMSLLSILINGFALYAYYGLWRMRRWSILGVLGVWAFNFLFSWLMPMHGGLPQQIRTGVTIIVLVIFVVVVLPHWNKMKGSWSFRP